VFKEFDLIANEDKTEKTAIGHNDMIDDQSWRKTRKLGSLLGVEEDVNRRIQLAFQSLNSLEAMWKHRDLVAQHIRIHAYRAIVESVLLYNCGTWALTEVLANKLDCSQRKMIRRVLGIKWSDKISNTQLYRRCGLQPASIQVVNARWRLFGHTLRMNEHTPARKAMAYYFVNDHKGRNGRRVTISTALSDEYKAVTGDSIKNTHEYESVVRLAQDRDTWKELVQDVTNTCINKLEKKASRKADLRHEAKLKRDS
jgi:hypothetical protein